MNDMKTIIPSYRWPRAVKDLDGGKCAFCGRNFYLESHHIKPRAQYPELENVLENGVTLCHWDHMYAHHSENHPVSEFIRTYEETRIVLTLPEGSLDEISAHATSCGESVNGFIWRAIQRQMQEDQKEKETE